MDEGPPPMRKRKPSKKTPTGADQFQADNTVDYDRGRGVSGAQQAEEHNTASPKMKDELDKRRSTGKVSAPIKIMARSQGSNMVFDPRCKLCQKMRRESESRRKRSQRHSASQNKRKRRVSKRRTKSSFRFERVKMNKGCQYYSPYSNKGTSADLALVGAETATNKMVNEESPIYFSSFNTTVPPINMNSDPVSSNSVPVFSGNIFNAVVTEVDTNTNYGAVLSAENTSSKPVLTADQNTKSTPVFYTENTKSTPVLSAENTMSRPVLTCYHNTNSEQLSNTSMSRNCSKSNVVSGQSANPGTSANTLSSYNSNLSLDHEPMVTS